MTTRRWTFALGAVLAQLTFLQEVNGQAPNAPPAVVAGVPVNYDESKAGGYILPDPLVFTNGKPVRTAKDWQNKRRPEIIQIFE